MKVPGIQSGVCFLAILLFCAPGYGQAEEQTTLATTIDALEQQLEMGRHEQFIKVKTGPSNKITPFTTDGCSGGLSVGWEYLAEKVEHFHDSHGAEPPWESCCVEHDRSYHTGGGDVADSRESFAARKRADQALMECVRRTGAARRDELGQEYGLSGEDVERLYTIISHLMYRAVRVGGMPCTGLPWRWGYGWPECEED